MVSDENLPLMDGEEQVHEVSGVAVVWWNRGSYYLLALQRCKSGTKRALKEKGTLLVTCVTVSVSTSRNRLLLFKMWASFSNPVLIVRC